MPQSRSRISVYGNPRSAFLSYFAESPYYAKPGHAAVQSALREVENFLKISRLPRIPYVFCNSDDGARSEIAQIRILREKEEEEGRRKEESVSRRSWSRVPGQTLYRVT